MRKWLIGLGIGALLLCGGVCLVSALLVRPPKIEIPPRQYPPNNAYDIYRQLGAEISERSKGNAQISVIARKLPRGTLTPAERELYLTFMEPYLREYRKHLNKPCVAVYEYDPNWLFPELTGFRSIARAEAYLMREDLRNRRDRSAVERFTSLLRFGNQIRNEGTLIHNLVGIALTNIGLSPLWEVSLQSEGALAEMVKTAQWYDKERVPPLRAVRAERYFGLSILNNLAEGKLSTEDLSNMGASTPASNKRNPFGVIISRLLVRTALPEYQKYMDTVEQQFQRPYWQRQKSFPEPRHFLNALLVPTYERYSLLETEERARIRLTGVMSAVRLYKLRNGRYPKNLETLNLGELIIDPFSGKPFVYRADPRKGFMLYSVGANGVDDGGAFPYEGARAEKGDLVPLYRPVPSHLPSKRTLHPPTWLR
ncbi:MAG: hypothetical protein SNJ72_02425 [Fimbriimonadales bacterium]